MLRSVDNRPVPVHEGSGDDRELQLLRRVARQDREAFKELYFIYHRRLLRFVMRMTLSLG